MYLYLPRLNFPWATISLTLGNLILTPGNCTLIKFTLDNLILTLRNFKFTLSNHTKDNFTLDNYMYPGSPTLDNLTM